MGELCLVCTRMFAAMFGGYLPFEANDGANQAGPKEMAAGVSCLPYLRDCRHGSPGD